MASLCCCVFDAVARIFSTEFDETIEHVQDGVLDTTTFFKWKAGELYWTNVYYRVLGLF